MSHSALVLQVLISSPSDLPEEHRQIVQRALRVWNATHGRIYGIHFGATDWQEGGTPEFGEYPQQILNEQIVADSDVGIVIFTERLGSPTPDYPSGTAEEIDRLLDAGKDVAVLQNDCPRPPSRGQHAAEQRVALERYMATLRNRAFIASYETPQRLREVTDTLLTRLAAKYRREADAALRARVPVEYSSMLTESSVSTRRGKAEEPTSALAPGVWPRVEVTETAGVDARGRIRSQRRWFLVLQNLLPEAVHDVRFRYEDADGNELPLFDLMADRHESVEIIAPRAEARFPILQSLGSPSAAICSVSWRDSQGKEQTTRASIRTS